MGAEDCRPSLSETEPDQDCVRRSRAGAGPIGKSSRHADLSQSDPPNAILAERLLDQSGNRFGLIWAPGAQVSRSERLDSYVLNSEMSKRRLFRQFVFIFSDSGFPGK